MSEVMRLVGRSLAPEVVLRDMLHLLSELLGLNRGRIVLADGVDEDVDVAKGEGEGEGEGGAPGPVRRAHAPGPSSVRFAYGLTRAEMARGRYAAGEGITGAVLATGQPMIVQDIDAEPRFLARAVERASGRACRLKPWRSSRCPSKSTAAPSGCWRCTASGATSGRLAPCCCGMCSPTT